MMSFLLQRSLTLTLPPLRLPLSWRTPLLAGGVLILGLALTWLPLPVSVLLIGGAIFLCFLLKYPLLSVYLLIPIIPFSSLLALPVGGFKVGVMELMLVAGLTAWLLRLSTRHHYPNKAATLPPAPLVLSFLLFLGCASLSWLNALSIGASLVETAKWVEMLALYLLMTTLLPRPQIKWVVAVLLLTGLVQAGLGLYQFIFKVGPEGFLLFGGQFLRAYGTFAQPNPYAGYLGLILPLALAIQGLGVRGQRLRSKVTLLRITHYALRITLYALPFALLLAALFASQSRSAWLAFGAAALVTLIALSKKPIVWLAGLALAGALVFLSGTLAATLIPDTNTPYGVIVQRLADAVDITTITDISTLEVTDANFATVERLAHWQAARDMWRDQPWLGVGFGNYAAVYPAYAVGRWLDPLGHAHNYLLNLGAETGLAGIIGYLIFWIWTFRVTWRAVRRSHGFERAVAAGGLGILVHLHIHNLFDNLYVQGMYLHVAIVLALISVIYLCKKETSELCY